MKIFELLSGDPNIQQPMSPETAPMAAMQQPSVQAPTTTPNQPPPTQTAGLGSMVSDFFSTPQPIGGNKPASTPAAAPTVPGQPPPQSSGMISRPFGGSAVGQNLDAINKALIKP